MTVEIIRDGTHMEGTLRLFEPGVGELQARFVGQWTSDNKLSASTLEHFMSNSGGAVALPQTGNMEATFDAKENVITGHWKTEFDALGEFRWMQVESPHPKPAGILVGTSAQFVRYWQHFAASTNMLLGKSKITWDKRYTKWLILGLQLCLAGLLGYVLVAVLIDFLVGN